MNSIPPSQSEYPQTPPPVPPRVMRRPAANPPYVTYFMIASSVLVYIGQMLTQTPGGSDLLTNLGAKVNSAIIAGQYWRLITPMWLHGSLLHIAFNMYALFIFGANLERAYGHGRFLLLYLLSGFAGNVISFMMSPTPSIGSSTAIFGLIAAQGVFLYQNRRLIRNAQGMLINTLTIAGINLVLGLSPGIDNWGHMGGLIGGLAFAWSAGPLWDVQTDGVGLRLVNQRSRQRVMLVAIGVAVVFAAVAFLKIWTS
ncbi:MAG: rhomboid family intramembrane serine protease [Chloroflexi bacterium]|nr:MAG: rhomboid family intramembrane serine protease [Chloroflexota bacterium]